MIAGILATCTLTFGQEPSGARSASAKSSAGSDVVTRMMKLDKNKDGKLTKSEITDARLRRLFDRADADKDGIVTRDELTALAAADRTAQRGGGPGGFGPPGGGPGGFGPPRTGEILPSFMQERLSLTAAQKKKVAELQKEVDAKLSKIMSNEQNEQLKETRERGPGSGPPGFGGPPPGGFPPGGPPPDGDGAPPPPPDESI
jgi:hypothetical protein